MPPSEFDPKAFLWFLTFVIQVAQAIWLYREKQQDKTEQKIADLDHRIDEIDKKTGEIDAAHRHSPTHGDLEKVYGSMNDLSRTVHQLVGQMENQTMLLRQLLNKAVGGKGE